MTLCIHCDQPIVKLLNNTWRHDAGDGEAWTSCRCACRACQEYASALRAGFSQTEAQEVYASVSPTQDGFACIDGEEATPPEETAPFSDPVHDVQNYGGLL